jgi:hypothetical protein
MVEILRQAARRGFETMSDYYDVHCPAENREALQAVGT